MKKSGNWVIAKRGTTINDMYGNLDLKEEFCCKNYCWNYLGSAVGGGGCIHVFIINVLSLTEQNRKKCGDDILWWNLLRTLIWEALGKQSGRTCGRDVATESSLTEWVAGTTTMNLSCNWGVQQLEASTWMKRSGSTGWQQDDNELAEWCIHKKKRCDIRTYKGIALHAFLVNYWSGVKHSIQFCVQEQWSWTRISIVKG